MLDAGFGTLSYLKSRILPASVADDFQWDDALCRVGLAVARKMNSYCNRTFERTLGQVDEFSALATAVVCRAFPIEAITSVEIRTWTGAVTAFTGGYHMDNGAGLLMFASNPGDGTERLVVTYDGGFWLDGGWACPAGATALPDDVLEAWVLLCQAWVEARKILGEVAMQSLEPKAQRPGSLTLEAGVAEILNPYRRYAGE